MNDKHHAFGVTLCLKSLSVSEVTLRLVSLCVWCLMSL